MGKPQRRRYQGNSSLVAVAGNHYNTMLFDETDAINFHGMHTCFSIEPENGDANANGYWVVYCLPAGVIDTTDLPDSSADFLAPPDEFLPYVWGIGCWTASNQAPFHLEFSPSTSRTCQKGGRVILQIFQAGISSGNSRVISTITGFT